MELTDEGGRLELRYSVATPTTAKDIAMPQPFSLATLRRTTLVACPLAGAAGTLTTLPAQAAAPARSRCPRSSNTAPI